MNIVRCDLSLITNCFEEMSMNNKNNNSWKDIIGEFSANSNVGLYQRSKSKQFHPFQRMLLDC